MQNILERLEKQLALQFPDILGNLNPPATTSQIQTFEEHIGQKLPDDLRMLYLWHDGCDSSAGPSGINLGPVNNEFSRKFLLVGNARWCGLDEALQQWLAMDEMAQGDEYFFTAEEDPQSWETATIRPWTSPPRSWLPLGRVDWSHWVYVDMLPGTKGDVAQLVELGFHSGMGPSLVATGIKTYLQALMRALERRELSYDINYHRWLRTVEFKCS
jgi:cell wall assembly regulator SMI1